MIALNIAAKKHQTENSATLKNSSATPKKASASAPKSRIVPSLEKKQLTQVAVRYRSITGSL